MTWNEKRSFTPNATTYSRLIIYRFSLTVGSLVSTLVIGRPGNFKAQQTIDARNDDGINTTHIAAIRQIYMKCCAPVKIGGCLYDEFAFVSLLSYFKTSPTRLEDFLQL